MVRRGRKLDLFHDEQGMTTAAMALCIMISLALVFSGAQAYRVTSKSAEVQDIADSAALAAENQVAEFMIVAQFCDSVVLSLTLTGLLSTGLGVVSLCTPATAGLSSGLLEAGRKSLDMRDSFSQKAAIVLNNLQKALPYFAAACASAVAFANNDARDGSIYLGSAILVDPTGKPIVVPSAGAAKDLAREALTKADGIKERALLAEAASKEANEAKEAAYMRDCGAAPGRCMYERASHLAGMAGSSNPSFSSIDTWSFSAALGRAKAYYRERLNREVPISDSIEEQVRSNLRKVFYGYANDLMSRAYVNESLTNFDAYFPKLPHNTSEMRDTPMYEQKVFPVCVDEAGLSIMHGYDNCPAITEIASYDSIATMEAESFEECPQCEFSATSLGKVAAATTVVDSGFEFHYEAVGELALKYKKAKAVAAGPIQSVQDEAGSLMQRIVALMKEAANYRLEAVPPGRFGAIAFVVNVGSTSASGTMVSNFVPDGYLGPRAAVSASTLLADNSMEGRNVINSMLDGLKRDGGSFVGAGSMVLGAWAYTLEAYNGGVYAITDGLQRQLDSLPLVGASGLGRWASKKISDTLHSFGLQPAPIKSKRAILVNSERVSAESSSEIGQRYTEVKRRVVSSSIGAADLFGMVLNDAEAQAIKAVDNIPDKVEITSIEILGPGGPSIPVTIPMPKAVKESAQTYVGQAFDKIRGLRGKEGGEQRWH